MSVWLGSMSASALSLCTGSGRADSIADVVTRMWASIVATDFKVVIEAWLAAANDPELGRAIGPVVERFAKLVHPEQRSDLLESAGDLLDVVSRGIVKIETNQSFPLEDAAKAHRALEGRETTGSTVLIP